MGARILWRIDRDLAWYAGTTLSQSGKAVFSCRNPDPFGALDHPDRNIPFCVIHITKHPEYTVTDMRLLEIPAERDTKQYRYIRLI